MTAQAETIEGLLLRTHEGVTLARRRVDETMLLRQRDIDTISVLKKREEELLGEVVRLDQKVASLGQELEALRAENSVKGKVGEDLEKESVSARADMNALRVRFQEKEKVIDQFRAEKKALQDEIEMMKEKTLRSEGVCMCVCVCLMCVFMDVAQDENEMCMFVRLCVCMTGGSGRDWNDEGKYVVYRGCVCLCMYIYMHACYSGRAELRAHCMERCLYIYTHVCIYIHTCYAGRDAE
jgi:hypothetical protein